MLVQGLLRYATLRWVFRWKDSWSDIRPPLIAAGIAIVPALICRGFLSGVVGQVTSAAVFLAVFGVQWWQHHVHRKDHRRLARSKDVPGIAKKRDDFIVEFLTTADLI